MEILDPDLWDDDGNAKKPTQEYMDGLEEIQAVDPRWVEDLRVETLNLRAATVGDIVHFWDHENGVCRAAIVMEADPMGHTAELRVHIPRRPFEDWAVDHNENRGENTWHWPCEGR